MCSLDGTSVIIPSHKLPAYFQSLQFPVQILEEKGDRIARIEDRAGLLMLIEADVVIGVGTWKRLRRLRLNMPVDALASRRIKSQASPVAVASQTTVLTRLESGHRVHSFHGPRCNGYRGNRARLDCSNL